MKKSNNKYERKYTPCKSGIQSLCCSPVRNIHLFFSKKKNGSIFTIFNQVSSKSGFVIYPLECKKCQMQYVGKAETDFN